MSKNNEKDPIELLGDDPFKAKIEGEITLIKGNWEKSFEFESIFELFEILAGGSKVKLLEIVKSLRNKAAY